MLPGLAKDSKLRDSCYACIKYKIGIGDSIFAWVDNWHPHGPLIKKRGARIVYDAACNIDC